MLMMKRNKYLIWLLALLLVGGVLFYLSSREAQAPIQTSVQNESSSEGLQTGESGQVSCSGEPTPSSTAGPYYKEDSPERRSIAEGQESERLIVEGYVLNTDCEPVAGAWIDFWQAGADGNYDLEGYNLRGHQYTNDRGRYRLETVMPTGYSGRTPHIHVKVREGGDSPILTTQLYFPGQERNRADSIFNEELVVDLQETQEGKAARFDFILN